MKSAPEQALLSFEQSIARDERRWWGLPWLDTSVLPPAGQIEVDDSVAGRRDVGAKGRTGKVAGGRG